MAQHPITTATASLALYTADILVWRYLPGALVNAEAIAENIGVANSFGAVPGVLVHIPEGVDFAMDMLDRDHGSIALVAPHTTAISMVVEDRLFREAAELYYVYHPQSYPVRFFDTVDSGLHWLEDHLASV